MILMAEIITSGNPEPDHFEIKHYTNSIHVTLDVPKPWKWVM